MAVSKRLRASLLAVLTCCGFVGCEHPHYVVKNPDSGIIAIAEDMPSLRAKAEKMMQEHLPAGYVIDAVRVVPLGRPYETVTQIGPVAEVQLHQRHEVMLYYHAGRPAVVPVRYDAPPPSVVAPVAQVVPVSATAAPAAVQAPGLPPQPIPVGN